MRRLLAATLIACGLVGSFVAAQVFVANGGAGDLLVGTSPSAFGRILPVAAGSYLRSAGTGTPPIWSTLTLPNTTTTGDLLTSTGTNGVGVVAAVATGQVLTSAGVGTVPAYSATPTVTNLSLGTGTKATSGDIRLQNGTTILSYARGGGGADVAAFVSDTQNNTSIGAVGNVTFSPGGGATWDVITSAANPIAPRTDNASDIGTTGLRVRTGYFGTSLVSPALNMGTGAGAGVLLCSNTAPTVSGFGTSPSVPNNNGTCGFTINVGTGGTASTGTITLPAATTAWHCQLDDVTTPASFITSQTGGTTTTATVTNYSRTTGLAIAWTASDILRVSCFGY